MSKTLVVYYSYTGNTKTIAKRIKEKLNCDILELEPVTPYSTDYDLVVKEEQNNASSNKTVAIKDISVDLNEYDEIIVGSPVWWYSIAPVVRTFLKENDMKDKKIIPFATNAGWLGQTFEEIKKLCPNSNVEKAMNIVYDAGDYRTRELITSIDEIDNWISTL